MTRRRLRTSVLTVLAIALLLAVAPASSDFVRTDPRVAIGARLGSSPSQANAQPALLEKIAFSSSRDTPGDVGQVKIWLMDPDGTDPERLTGPADCLPTFPTCGDAFAVLSPDGKRIVFDSNRKRIVPDEPRNTSDLFMMQSDGDEQTFLARGSSASWAPRGALIAFHRSASGTGLPIREDPGAPAPDSDIFVMDIDAGGGADEHHQHAGAHRRRPALVARWAADRVHAPPCH
jgi:hypothetical protein